MSNSPSPHKVILMLLDRLERIPADSAWAHKASGVRGALLRSLDEALADPVASGATRSSLESGFEILREVARERLKPGPLARRA